MRGKIVALIKEAIEADNKKRSSKEPISFHQEIQLDTFDTSELSSCLDQWSTKHKKNKKKSEKVEKPQDIKIEVFDKGSAALVTSEVSNKEKWGSDEEEEEPEVKIIETPVETMTIDSDGSEEDAVVVLNADQKTNKKKKIRK
ncbi:unnamed protein product [Brassicogethes aeneus]|uniref:Uncharacterized protein n=1 Tax=Brassicogethes aeneus TaxID=1431903 RepID=A0A9P0BER8_BRAAE|nr:unnamed protein product [Brassicogethes aeneus]